MMFFFLSLIVNSKRWWWKQTLPCGLTPPVTAKHTVHAELQHWNSLFSSLKAEILTPVVSFQIWLIKSRLWRRNYFVDLHPLHLHQFVCQFDSIISSLLNRLVPQGLFSAVDWSTFGVKCRWSADWSELCCVVWCMNLIGSHQWH